MGVFLTPVVVLFSALSSLAGPPTLSLNDLVKLKVERYELKNGLRVLFHEDHRVPVVNLQLWYKVGSVNEGPGQTGLAHFFEHLMFRGTKKYPGDKLQSLVQGSGGDNNAFTTFDHTGYHVTFPPKKMDLFLDIEADRMVNLDITKEVVDKEREVVKEELRRKYARVEGVLWEALFASVFKVHPYRFPVIGSMEDLNRATLEDLYKFYRTYYSPNNAVLVLSGDFSSAQAKSLVSKYFGSLKPQKIPELMITAEPEQKGERGQVLKKDVQATTVNIGFKSVEAGHADSYAMDLLASILGDGQSSRLHKRLVYQAQIATAAGAWSFTPRFPGLLQVSLHVKPGQDADKAVGLVLGEIYKVRNVLVTLEELEKARNMLIKEVVDSLKTVEGRADQLVSSEVTLGSYEKLFQEFARYFEVTPEDIKRVAETYLKPERRSVVKAVPKSEGVKL